jgi:hypothetical protein
MASLAIDCAGCHRQDAVNERTPRTIRCLRAAADARSEAFAARGLRVRVVAVQPVGPGGAAR